MNSVLPFIILSVLIVMSAYFAATETAFTSLNRIRLKNMHADGNKRAMLVLKLYKNYDKLLSTVLIGNNIVNIAAASLAAIVFIRYFGDAGITVSTIVMTVLLLIFGEISPKSLAKEAPEKFAMFSAPLLRIFVVLFSPINFFFVQWKKLISFLIKNKEDRKITEEEIITIIEEAQQSGVLDREEGELIRSAIEFNDLAVIDVYTPRVDIAAISNQESKQEIANVFKQTRYSRLPVFEGTIDKIIGVIHQKDFYYIVDTDMDMTGIIKPALFITPTMKISKLLKLLQKTKSHIAVITDEFGGTVGIVTLEDILEELVGEIWDEHDEIIQEFEKISDNEYKIICNTDLEKMFHFFQLNQKGKLKTSTVSGWVIQQLDRIPNEGDKFTYENLTITIHKTDFRRIIEIIVAVNR